MLWRSRTRTLSLVRMSNGFLQDNLGQYDQRLYRWSGHRGNIARGDRWLFRLRICTHRSAGALSLVRKHIGWIAE